jgi:hypothetical protein
LLVGGLFAVPGLLLILTGFNVIDIYPELTHGPRWVISVTGLPFFAWGVWIASGAFDRDDEKNSAVAQVAKHVLILANLIPMAGIFLWGGFGPGERHFQTETTIGSYSVTGPGSELVGRCVYGAVGLVMAVLVLLYVRHNWIRSK